MKTLFTAAIILSTLSACTPASGPVDGRATFDGSAFASMDREAAAQAGKRPINPQVIYSQQNLGGAYGFARADHLNDTPVITIHEGVKNFHVYHELAHVYQLDGNCVQRESDAMVKTWKWCETHNCPVHELTAERIKTINCK